MRRDGVAFALRVRGYSEKHFVATAGKLATASKLEVAARQGYLRKGQKQ